MGHGQVVYELVRDGRHVYCSSFAVLVALVSIGWTVLRFGRVGQVRERRGKRLVDSIGDT